MYIITLFYYVYCIAWTFFKSKNLGHWFSLIVRALFNFELHFRYGQAFVYLALSM